MKTTINAQKLAEFTGKKYESGDLDNDGLVQQIIQCGSYLNIMSIPEYQKKYKMSYNGVKNHRTIVTIFNKKFVIDNQ